MFLFEVIYEPQFQNFNVLALVRLISSGRVRCLWSCQCSRRRLLCFEVDRSVDGEGKVDLPTGMPPYPSINCTAAEWWMNRIGCLNMYTLPAILLMFERACSCWFVGVYTSPILYQLKMRSSLHEVWPAMHWVQISDHCLVGMNLIISLSMVTYLF